MSVRRIVLHFLKPSRGATLGANSQALTAT